MNTIGPLVDSAVNQAVISSPGGFLLKPVSDYMSAYP